MTNGKKLFVAASPLLLLFALTAGIRLTESNPEIPPAVEENRPDIPTPFSTKLTPAAPHLQATLKQVVLGQIRAFHTGDYKAALNYSVPRFRATWTPERFHQMIETSFSPLAASRYEKCLPAVLSGKKATMTVQVVNAVGMENVFIYSLENVDDHWLVGGCSAMMTPTLYADGMVHIPVGHPPFGRLRGAARTAPDGDLGQ
jgi:hypothetical protein